MPKVIEIGKYLFKLQLKMSGVFFLRHTVHWPPSEQRIYLQAVSVHAPHLQWTSTTILVRLCIQFLQLVTDTGWGRLAQRSMFCLEQEPDLENVFFLLRSSRLEHSSFRPSRHYWHQYFQNDSRVYLLIMLTLLDALYSETLQIPYWLISWCLAENY